MRAHLYLYFTTFEGFRIKKNIKIAKFSFSLCIKLCWIWTESSSWKSLDGWKWKPRNQKRMNIKRNKYFSQASIYIASSLILNSFATPRMPPVSLLHSHISNFLFFFIHTIHLIAAALLGNYTWNLIQIQFIKWERESKKVYRVEAAAANSLRRSWKKKKSNRRMFHNLNKRFRVEWIWI